MTPYLEMKEKVEKLQGQVDALMIERFKSNPSYDKYFELAYKLRKNNPGSVSHELAALNLSEAAWNIKNLHTALKDLLKYSSAQICTHDETYKGGTIWEICDQCGVKWADDRGGKPKFEWPKEILNAEKVLNGL